MLIRYVGSKQRKTDNVAGTGLVWNGNGDVQDVPDAAAAKLLQYPDVWAHAGDGQPGIPPPYEPPKFVLLKSSGEEVVLDTLPLEQLVALAVEVEASIEGTDDALTIARKVYEHVQALQQSAQDDADAPAEEARSENPETGGDDVGEPEPASAAPAAPAPRKRRG